MSQNTAKKWGVYESELEIFEWAREWLPHGFKKRTLEAAVMDWADDVAYAVHDLEDFFRAGLVPLDLLYSDENEQNRFLEAEFARQKVKDASRSKRLTKVFKQLLIFSLISSPYRGTHADRADLRSFTSHLINRYITATSLRANNFGEDALEIKRFARDEVSLLKGLTWYYVINSEAMAAQRVGQAKIITCLFDEMFDAAQSGDKSRRYIFPSYQQEQLAEARTTSHRARVVADYLAGMSEAQVIALHLRLTGSELGSSFGRSM
jgi:dGTPase